jgi:thymidylate synthase (FAD)
MKDVLSLVPALTIPRLDKGFVELVDVMPRLVEDNSTADSAIVQAARVSFGSGTKSVSEDRGLIRYLMRHSHTTPFEMVEFKFHCAMPIFVARQWIRHRTANVNEVSGRYSVLKDDFYRPDAESIRQQSKTNKQGGEQKMGNVEANQFANYLTMACEKAYERYTKAIEDGVSREQARMILPVNLYTEWYWKIDLHNLFHFLGLRCDAHAQLEIRTFADAMLELISPVVPWAVEAWNDYHPMRGAMKLSRLEVDALRESIEIWKGLNPEGEHAFAKAIASDNKREQEEWKAKTERLGMDVET